MRFILLWLCFFGSAFALKVDLTAKAAILINADTGAVLYEKNAHAPAFPGSTTKVATALYVLEEKNLDFNRMVSVSAEAVRRNQGKRTEETPAYWLDIDDSLMGIVRGEIASIESLMHGMLLVSGNDAANVIAETVSGSVPKFMGELNDYLQRLGLTKTYFTNPHGYPHHRHMSTPYDMAQMTRRAFQLPQFREIVRKPTYLRPKTNKRAAGEMRQSNLLVVPTSKHYYPKAIGGKTGHHSKAGWCLTSLAEHEGRTLIAVVFGCPKNADRFMDSRKLFEAAFAEKQLRRVVVSRTQDFTKPVEGAKKPLKALLSKDLSLTYYPSEEPKVKTYIYWNPPKFPIQKGDKVGEVRAVDSQGSVLAQEDLKASEAISPTFFFALKEKWNQFFR